MTTKKETARHVTMKIIYTPGADPEFQFTCAPHRAGYKAAIDAIRNWTDAADLVAFAESQQGYQNTDGFFGITYPCDLDEFDIATGHSIPNDFVEANAWYGASAGERHQIPEAVYLDLLHQFLTLTGHLSLAKRIERILST